MDEYEDRNLMAIAESMLRAGYSHRQIERALRRMSPNAGSDSGRLAVLGSLRRLLAHRGISRRRPTQPASASSK
jgi:DNA primase RepB-like protein